MDDLLTITLLASVVRLTMPLAIAAIGEIVSERAGIFNVSIEGFMLMGAFAAVWGAQMFGSIAGGIGFALLAVIPFALLVGYLKISLGLDQIVVGIVFTVLALGLTAYLNDLIFAGQASAGVQLNPVAIPILSDIPVIGPALFAQTVPVYLGYLLIAVVAVWLYRSKSGLVLRGTGDNPAAVEHSGYSVQRFRYGALLFGCLCASFAGALISLGTGGIFVDNMTAGRGWIALIAVTLGRWRPLLAVGACMLFGIGDALQFRLQVLDAGLPPQLFLAIPYVLTLVVLFAGRGGSGQPKMLGVPYPER